jgi:hypothetical protein
MSPSLRTVLLGSEGHDPFRGLLLAPLCFLGVFAAYAVGVFDVSGGVVFLAGQAAVVGTLAAAALAYRRDGLAAAWIVVYAALLGSNADHYLLGLSGRPVGERIVAFLGIDGLVFVGIQALVLGTLAWVAGSVLARAVAVVRDRRVATRSE